MLLSQPESIHPPKTDETDLPPVVIDLMNFYEGWDADPDSDMHVVKGGFEKTKDDILARHGYEPADSLSQDIATSVRAITNKYDEEKALRTVNDFMLTRQVGLGSDQLIDDIIETQTLENLDLEFNSFFPPRNGVNIDIVRTEARARVTALDNFAGYLLDERALHV